MGCSLECRYLLRSHKDVRGVEIHFTEVWRMSVWGGGGGPHKKKKVRTPILHSQWHFFIATKRTINCIFFFPPLCLCCVIFKSHTVYFCFRQILVFDLHLYRTDIDPSIQFLTAAAHKRCPTRSCYPHACSIAYRDDSFLPCAELSRLYTDGVDKFTLSAFIA